MSDKGRAWFLKLFSSAILTQALLSGANLCVSLLLIRRTADSQYGYYVLVYTAVLLCTAIQAAFIYPPLVACINNPDNDQQKRSDFVGGMYRGQRLVSRWLAFSLTLAAMAAGALGLLSLWTVALLVAGITTGFFALRREYFRMLLLSYRRPDAVLYGDVLYAGLLVIATLLATITPHPALFAVCGLLIAAWMSGRLQLSTANKHEPWNTTASSATALSVLYPTGLWAVTGAILHWVVAQGYNYLVAGSLSVASVAAIAATRTVVMPINLVSTGIASFMLPTMSAWVQRLKPGVVFTRMLLLAIGLTAGACLYLLVAWLARDWIFKHILNKQFSNQDALLSLWFVISIAMLLRDQLLYMVLAKSKFRSLFGLTLTSAVLSMTTSYLAIRQFGEKGALYGLLVGEIISVIGLLLLSARELARAKASPLNSAA